MEFKVFVAIAAVVVALIVAGVVLTSPPSDPPLKDLEPDVPVIPVATPSGNKVEASEIPIVTPVPTATIPIIQSMPLPTAVAGNSTNATPTSTKPTPTIYYSNNVITDEMIDPLPTSTITNTGEIRVADGNTVNTWNVEHANYVEKTHHYVPYTTEAQDYKNQKNKIFAADQWVTHDTWHYKYLSLKNKYESELDYYTMHPQQKTVAKQNELNKMKTEVDEYKRICDQLCADCRYCNYYWRGIRS